MILFLKDAQSDWIKYLARKSSEKTKEFWKDIQSNYFRKRDQVGKVTSISYI